ncbi:MAG: HlyC/CorC family transporter [Lachnospiraceae bacterium]|nr:HlyC/CorC family transporter [Lachnospiraceae bacterium]MBQ2504090.1 HlyC/CorC family transporter [Lachnospiraceae bacterium]MBQ4372642.1 HlyC/CorC family transporter [Lachnospiraceae bacterium]
MDQSTIIQLIILVFLLFLSAFFSSAETALTTVSKIRLKTMADDGDKRAARVLKVTADSHKMLSAILIGNNIVNLSASSLATTISMRFFGSYGAGIATGILTFLVLIFGEITPKSMATVEALKMSLFDAPIIEKLMWALTPLIVIVNAISHVILRLFGVKEAPRIGMTSDELRTIVDVSHESGTIETDEKDYIHNVFDFSDSAVKEVMIPRIDMAMVNVNWSYDKLIEIFQENMYTRLPVYENDTDNIIGIVNMKDLLLAKEEEHFSIKDHLREVYFTYEQKNTAELFDEMRQGSISLAIVLDEYSAVAGLVTLEDLLEELVGEIRDEYDDNEEDDIVRISEREFDVLGSANLDDLSEELDLGFSSEDYDTIGGYLIGLFDHFPMLGETYFTEEGVMLRVTSVRKKRIEKIRIKLPEHFHETENEE